MGLASSGYANSAQDRCYSVCDQGGGILLRPELVTRRQGRARNSSTLQCPAGHTLRDRNPLASEALKTPLVVPLMHSVLLHPGYGTGLELGAGCRVRHKCEVTAAPAPKRRRGLPGLSQRRTGLALQSATRRTNIRVRFLPDMVRSTSPAQDFPPIDDLRV
jgi:hypothetical protein